MSARVADRAGRAPPRRAAEFVLPEGWCQRWRHGQHSFVHRSAGGFRSEHYSVEPVDTAAARGFVQTHHYAGSWVVDRIRLGLFHTAGSTPALIRVAVFGIPMSKKVLPSSPQPGTYLRCCAGLCTADRRPEVRHVSRAFNEKAPRCPS